MKHLFSALLFAVLFSVQYIHAQTANKDWTFVSKVYDSDRSIAQGQKITVKWQSINRLETSNGKLVDITVDSLYLKIKKHQLIGFSKSDIIEIRAKGSKNRFRKFCGFLVFMGALIAGFYLFSWIIEEQVVGSGEQTNSRRNFFIGIGLLLIGLPTLIKTSGKEKTSNPFGENWNVQEIPAKAIKTP